MTGISRIHPPAARPAEEALSYSVELGDGSTLAVCQSGAVAYAAYYAAIREYLGQPLCLRHRGVVIASFKG